VFFGAELSLTHYVAPWVLSRNATESCCDALFARGEPRANLTKITERDVVTCSFPCRCFSCSRHLPLQEKSMPASTLW
jgi:hypothetical protein